MNLNSIRSFGQPVIIMLAASLLFSSCASSTYIQSIPAGAKLYIDGEPAGTTPYYHSDTKIAFSQTSVRLEKEGYETMQTFFARDEQADVGAIIAGLFVYVPFLWLMKYKPQRIYELKPLTDSPQPHPGMLQPEQGSKAERLREYKKLLDDKILTPEEFEQLKKRVLEE